MPDAGKSAMHVTAWQSTSAPLCYSQPEPWLVVSSTTLAGTKPLVSICLSHRFARGNELNSTRRQPEPKCRADRGGAVGPYLSPSRLRVSVGSRDAWLQGAGVPAQHKPPEPDCLPESGAVPSQPLLR